MVGGGGGGSLFFFLLYQPVLHMCWCSMVTIKAGPFNTCYLTPFVLFWYEMSEYVALAKVPILRWV